MVFSGVREWRFNKILCFCTVVLCPDQTHFLIDSIFSRSGSYIGLLVVMVGLWVT